MRLHTLLVLLASAMTATSGEASLLEVSGGEITVDNGRFVAVIDQRTGMIERAHLVGSDFELVCQSGAFTLFFPEFEVPDPGGWYKAGRTQAPGYSDTGGVTVTILLDDPDLSVVRAVWTTDWMEVRWTYRFLRGAPTLWWIPNGRSFEPPFTRTPSSV